ncbi:MAG: PQQ-binding-like beta-propeller repeat protein, partial [Armatimonadota bacterium]
MNRTRRATEPAAASLAPLFASLRPYGGVACLRFGRREREALAEWRRNAPDGATVDESGDYTLIRRVGPLPGAGQWTHELGDAGNTCSSADELTRAPLGVLWFGGPGGDEVFFNRHTHPPRVQVAGGRMFVNGANVIHALDVYTGRLLWQTAIPGLGAHFTRYGFYPGARIVGSQYASTSDSVYVTTGSACLRLDAATGERMAEFSLPTDGAPYDGPVLGYVAVWRDMLLAGGNLLIGNVDFFAEDFEAFPQEILANLIEFIDSCQGFTPIANGPAETDAASVANNLNALLDEPRLAATLPADFPGKARAAVLSGGDWLNTDKGVPGRRLFCTYDVRVPGAADYTFWARKFYHHGPFRWRFDDQPWAVCDRGIPLADSIYMRANICANWKNLGTVALSQGTHTLRIELLNAPGEDGAAAFDCFLLTTGADAPERKLKPAPHNGAATVWWEGEDATEHNFPQTGAFDPLFDPDDAQRDTTARDLAQRIAAHVAQAGTPRGTDTKLRQLNRQLLEARYPMLTLHLPKRYIGASPWDGAASRQLIAMDRHDGRILWTRDARHSFRHSAIAIGGGRVFCLDRLPDRMVQATRRRGASPAAGARLMALDARTGEILWSTEQDVDGSRLAYSAEHDILLQGLDRFSLMRGKESPGQLIAYNAASGDVLWDRAGKPFGTLIVLDDSIIVDSNQFDLRTGEARAYRVYASTKGCGGAIAGKNLITFRSSTAAYVDLLNPGGATNFGGVRAGCTESLIPADGVLNAPNLAHGCSCNYPIYTSLALVHMPDAEMWGLSRWPEEGPVGVNFGAPGSRRADDRTLWLEFPSTDYQTERPVTIAPENAARFHVHSSRLEGAGLKWVAASGCRGLTSATITLPSAPTAA